HVCEPQRPQRRMVTSAPPTRMRISVSVFSHLPQRIPAPPSEPDVRDIGREGGNLEPELARQRPASTEIAVSRLKPAWRRIAADRFWVRMARPAETSPSTNSPGTAITEPIVGLESGWTAANAKHEAHSAHAGVVRASSA